MAERRDVVFVHIPKTGGTSVRAALEQALNDRLILHDYGKEPETTPELLQLVLRPDGMSNFRKHFKSPRGILLTGHIQASRYWDYFNAESFVTFLRHPVDRTLSAYAHWVNHRGWTGSFDEFLAKPGSCNQLSWLLAGTNLDDLGFVGFMEDFAASLQALGQFIGKPLSLQKLNIGNYAAVDSAILESDECRRMVTERSLPDIALYERLRKARWGTFLAPKPKVSIEQDYKGSVSLKDGVIVGWLCNTAREFIPEVEVLQSGIRLALVKADRYRERLKEKRISRSGICGFRIDPAALKLERSASSPVLTFCARDSSYELEGSPLRP
ncbi:MAG: sulfotransferase family 2 domain-containing protein [Alphaproteobacteria bacterium]|nr:sulfotransferase family 2 domain-containing protein [Alphaproteobacteria bacterium]